MYMRKMIMYTGILKYVYMKDSHLCMQDDYVYLQDSYDL